MVHNPEDYVTPQPHIPRIRDRSTPYQIAWALFNLFGVDVYPSRGRRAVKHLPQFCGDWFKYNRLETNANMRAKLTNLHPVLADIDEPAGQVDAHYFYQDIWAARRVYKSRPTHHVDIGSRLDGFVAHVLSFVPVTVIDIRPGPIAVTGLTFMQDNATTLDRLESDSIGSLSSLHVGEHFGLGRYGDPIDPTAHLKFMASLARVLRPGGRLLFSVPSGVEKVCFNSYRVLSPDTILNAFSTLHLVSFSAITDEGTFLEDCTIDVIRGAEYGCGLYEFTKL